jgi:hypothetical protein
MKKECKGMGFLRSFLSAAAIVLATASNAFANNAPGPLAILSVFSLLILIVALTLAGGGNVVLARLQIDKYPSRGKRILMNLLQFIAGVVLFFVGIMTTVLGVAGFSIYAIARGVKMILWARAAEKEGTRPAHLEGASPKRLKLAGVVLIVLTASIFGYSMLNVDDVTGAGEWKKRTYARILGYEAKNAHAAAMAFLTANPKAGKVTCEDMMKAGYTPSPSVTCFSDMTAASGVIRVTGPERWKLKNPVATITYAGELTPAEQ